MSLTPTGTSATFLLRRRRPRRLGLVLGLLAAVPLVAKPVPSTKVEVRAVQFSLVNAPGTTGRWLETDVELDASVLGGSGQFIDRVLVALEIGTRALGGSYRFYRAQLEAVALEAGSSHFRFYLPPELVRRDGLGGEPEFWAVRIIAAGAAGSDSPRNASATLRESARRQAFEARITADAPANDGVLLPQHLTPWAGVYPAATPSPVRRSQ
jgi:hypothetical protein